MLSCMSSPQGLTVIGPQGQPLRVLASSPAYTAARDLMQRSLTAEQIWGRLQELVSNPLKAMTSWGERFGVVLRDEAEFLFLNDIKLGRSQWLPMLNKLEATAGSPQLALRLAAALGGQAETAMVSQMCVHVPEKANAPLRLLQLELLPAGAMPGDRVVSPAKEGDWFFVSYGAFAFKEDGSLDLREGVVLQKVPDGAAELVYAKDVLAQPFVLGYNRTYRCELGTADGWLADHSFDSLVQAQRNAKEIRDSGDEARIVNRITKEIVRLD